MMDKDFETTLTHFLNEWEDRVRPNYERNFNNLTYRGLNYTKGRKYIKITHDTSVVAFIDMKTGDIFKPASWKSPAKHARGNLFSEHGGFEAVYGVEGGHFFVRYLK